MNAKSAGHGRNEKVSRSASSFTTSTHRTSSTNYHARPGGYEGRKAQSMTLEFTKDQTEYLKCAILEARLKNFEDYHIWSKYEDLYRIIEDAELSEEEV